MQNPIDLSIYFIWLFLAAGWIYSPGFRNFSPKLVSFGSIVSGLAGLGLVLFGISGVIAYETGRRKSSGGIIDESILLWGAIILGVFVCVSAGFVWVVARKIQSNPKSTTKQVPHTVLHKRFAIAAIIISVLHFAPKLDRAQQNKAGAQSKDLKAAIETGDLERVKQLVDLGISFHPSEKLYRRTPINLSLRNNRFPEITRFLIERTPQLSDEDFADVLMVSDADTIRVALKRAPSYPRECDSCVGHIVRLEDTQLIFFLLDELAKLTPTTYGVALEELFLSVREPRFNPVQEKTFDFLISRGAKLENLRGGLLPFFVRGQLAANSAQFELLKAKGISLDLQDKNGNTFLHYVSNQSSADRYKKLIELGANPEIKNAAGKTASELSASTGN